MVKNTSFPRLFTAGNIGEMTLRNRIIMPCIATGYGIPTGYVPQRMKDYLEERAKGGAGLIIIEYTCVEPGKQFLGKALHIDDDKFISYLAEAASAIKRHGAKVGIQLAHAGQRMQNETGSQPNVSPSTLMSGFSVDDWTITEINEIVSLFFKAAQRAKKAGVDGIEIHAAHGSNLISRFLSPASNKRQDAYGGSINNRVRLLLEVIDAVRESVGPTFPVWCRISGGGTGIAAAITNEELQEQVRMLEDSGIQAISVSGSPDVQSYFSPSGYFIPFARLVKKSVKIPVIVAGGITPELGERVMEEGTADFVVMARGIIADPELPNKLRSGRLDDVVPCIRCLYCHSSVMTPDGMQCSVNASVGREQEYKLKLTSKTKKVLIVGGGPAGMEAARVAALREHNVTQYERNNKLGGQMILAAESSYKGRIADFTRYLIRQIDKLKVHTVVGKEITPIIVNEINPDVVILATGVLPFIPQIYGINGDNVVAAQDVLSHSVEAGERVVIIGGELVACETALFLSEKGRNVTLTRRGSDSAVNVTPLVREPLLNLLKAKDITMLSGVKYEQIDNKGLAIINREGHRETIEADTIVLAAGVTPNKELLKQLEGKVPEIYLAGDCVQPRNIHFAIIEGFNIARTL